MLQTNGKTRYKKHLFLTVFLILWFSTGLLLGQGPNKSCFVFDYAFQVKDIPAEAKDLQVWIPIPAQNEFQKVELFESTGEIIFVTTTDPKYKNKLYYTSIEPTSGTMVFNLRYRVIRFEISMTQKPMPIFPVALLEPPAELDIFLSPNKLVIINDSIRLIASAVTEGNFTTVEKAKAIYDYVFDNMSYDKSIAGWGDGNVARACDMKTGNCTDFHSLFISLCRASQIPAKFYMGVPFMKETLQHTSYHCWAAFYDENLGWIPVDISEAWKDPSLKEYYFGNINDARIELTQGRDLVLEPRQKGDALNYFVYPYVEIDGKPHANVETKFGFQLAEIPKKNL